MGEELNNRAAASQLRVQIKEAPSLTFLENTGSIHAHQRSVRIFIFLAVAHFEGGGLLSFMDCGTS
jgi:hypothetical protein